MDKLQVGFLFFERERIYPFTNVSQVFSCKPIPRSLSQISNQKREMTVFKQNIIKFKEDNERSF